MSRNVLAWVERLEPRCLLSANTADLDAPTSWHWLQGVTPDVLAQQADSHGERIVDLKVQTTSPLTFTAALVKNSGAYASAWWWYYGQTPDSLGTILQSGDKRLVKLDPYVVDDQLLFAVLIVPNTGDSAIAWYDYYGESADSVAAHVDENNARLVDLEPYQWDGQTQYADIMVDNTGSDAKAWWWYTGATPDDISSALTSNNARLIDLNNEGDGVYDAIMQGNDGAEWWWYTDASQREINAAVAQDHARIFSVDSNVLDGRRVFSAVLINNADPLETNLGNILRSGNDSAVSGIYLKRVGGGTIVDINSQQRFEPASAIKSLLAVTALRRAGAQGEPHRPHRLLRQAQ